MIYRLRSVPRDKQDGLYGMIGNSLVNITHVIITRLSQRRIKVVRPMVVGTIQKLDVEHLMTLSGCRRMMGRRQIIDDFQFQRASISVLYHMNREISDLVPKLGLLQT
jgi:hypothetical protein